MNKMELLKAVLHAMEEDLRIQLKGQEAAAEGATHAETRAETKWDTCGLEQSYLARGLATQFEKRARQVEELRGFRPPDFAGSPIGIGALVETEMSGDHDLFFLLDSGGGTEIHFDGRTIAVVTPESPLGAALMGKEADGTYSFRAGSEGRVVSVE